MKSSLEEISARREKLTTLLKKEGYQSVATLAGKLTVSEATIRRDLIALEQENRITRTHGGALSEYDALFMPFYQRNAQNREQKTRLSWKAAEMIEEGQRVFLDAGSTIYAVAERISERNLEAVEVITNNLPVAEILASSGTVTVHLLGGRLLPHQLIVVGTGSSLSLSPWEFDISFLSAEGMNVNGLWNSRDEISDFQRHICARSTLPVFCIDDSKLGQSAPSFLMPWPEVDRIISTASIESFTAHGINLEKEQWVGA